MKSLSLALILLASAAGWGVSLLGHTDELLAEAAVYEHALAAATEQTAAQNRAFINVEGADLRARLDAALKQGRSRSPRTRFWTAYAFDVRPGLGIDVVIIHGNGSQTVFSGVTSGASSRYETRNIGVFLLHESDGSTVVRAELYNLERPREYSGYPVFWLGRGGNEESLGLLRKLIDSTSNRKVAENLTDAIGAHDDPRVEAMLKELVRGSSVVEVRETAVSWLAHFPGNIDFLSDLVRNEREHHQVREEAVEAIGHSRDTNAMAALQGLFTSLSDRELRKEIVEAAAHNDDQEASVSFLIKVAESEPEGEVRRQAIESMGHKSDRRSFQSLEKIAADSRSDAHSQREAVEAIGQREKDQAVPALTRIAKSHPRMEVRREALEALSHMPGQTAFLEELALSERETPELRAEAIRALGDSPSPDSISTLEKLYKSIADRRLKHEVINAIEDCSDKAAAVELLIKIARTEQDRETRARAVSTLGDMDEDRAADSLFELYNAERDEQVKEEVLEALGESSSKGSLQKLIDVARSDPSPRLRKKAVLVLSERDDPEAIKFLEGIVKQK